MKHFTTPEFWECYDRLIPSIRRLADRNFELLKDDSGHPSLHFKKVGAFWSARVGIQFRALSIKDDQGDMFWIGSHADYDRLIS